MKNFWLLIFLLVLLQFLISCIRTTVNINAGFDNLKSGDLAAAESIFNDCLLKSKDTLYKSMASEGLGWIEYLRENLPGAKEKFENALNFNPQNYGAESGLTITLARDGEWTEAILRGKELLELNDFSIDYLPSTLYREEVIKMIAVSALITEDATVLETAVIYISDSSFVDRLNLLRGE